MHHTRRNLLITLAAGPLTTVLSTRMTRAQDASSTLPPTPMCLDDGEATPASSEGPFYVPDSPLRSDLTGEIAGGQILIIGGLVLDTACQPVPDAVVSLWQADADGRYDNTGFRLRGHQFSGADGHWSFRTIVPALYPGRTRHIHFKVQRRDGPVLTTELFFPDEPGNANDRQFDPRLLLAMDHAQPEQTGTYDFVIA
jgi:protocatechuate 3,4-dioxygenase beta subunit